MKGSTLKASMFVCALIATAALSGCAGREFAPKRQYLWYHKELPAADRAVEAARKAGKNKECPAEFQAAEKMKNEAYEIYWSCRTAEGIAKANEATAKANGLCGKKDRAGHPSGKRPAASKPAADARGRQVIDRVTLHINFDTDKSEIRNADLSEVQMAVAFVKKHPGSTISVEGYTDDRGSDEHNLKLSHDRAEAVKKYLETHGGLSADSIVAVGRGKANPIGDNATETGRFENRRVEILIIGD